jgi:hypothetical protein
MDTVVLVFFLDPCALDRFAVEDNAVVIFDLTDGADCFLDILDGCRSSSKHVQILCGPVCFACPERKQRSALDCELVAVGRAAQPIQESFNRISSKDSLIVLAPALGQSKQTRAD